MTTHLVPTSSNVTRAFQAVRTNLRAPMPHAPSRPDAPECPKMSRLHALLGTLAHPSAPPRTMHEPIPTDRAHQGAPARSVAHQGAPCKKTHSNEPIPSPCNTQRK